LINFSAILSRKFANKEWALDGNDYDSLQWFSEGEKPTKKELEDLWSEVSQMIADEKQTKKEAKLTALAKLEALGLTEDDLKALGL
jgi:hypothetical protein